MNGDTIYTNHHHLQVNITQGQLANIMFHTYACTIKVYVNKIWFKAIHIKTKLAWVPVVACLIILTESVTLDNSKRIHSLVK